MKKLTEFNEYNTYKIMNAEKLAEVYKNTMPFVDLTITSPPYWNAKDYGGVSEQTGYSQSFEEYKKSLKTIFRGVYKISKETASLYLIIDTIKRDNKIIRLPDIIADILEKVGWFHQDTIIWDKVKTLPWSRKGQSRNIFEYILVFSKTPQNYTYNDDNITVVEPKEWWKDYPERYSPRGTIPENIWTFAIPSQGSWGQSGEKDKLNHACPFPARLANRIIKLSSNEGDVVFDPFAGSGVELCVAEKLGRRYFGIDVNDNYREMFNQATRTYVDKEWDDILIEEKINQDRINEFKGYIANLRCIKFGKEILKRLSKIEEGCKGVIAEADICNTFTKKHIADVKCTLILDDNVDVAKILDSANTLASKAPLSKYSIEAKIIAVRMNELTFEMFNGVGNIYKNYKASENRNIFEPAILDDILEEINGDNRFLPVFSNIAIIKEDIDRIETIE